MLNSPLIILPLSLFGGLSIYPLLLYSIYSKSATLFSVCLSLILASRLCEDDKIARWIKTKSIDDVCWFGKYEPLKEKEIVFLIPHGIFCLEGFISCIDKGLHHGYTMLIDNKLFYGSPTTILVSRAIGSRVSPLKHKTIMSLMQKGISLVLFPGGFVEVTGYNKDTYSINTSTYGYWIKQCQTYGYNLRIHFVYNQNDFYKQSSFKTELRTKIAGRYHIPLMLPYSINRPNTLFARCLYYNQDIISKESIDTMKAKIESELRKFYDLDIKDIKHINAKLKIVSKL